MVARFFHAPGVWHDPDVLVEIAPGIIVWDIGMRMLTPRELARLSALFVLGLLRADGFLLLLGVSLAQAAVLAPVTILADALASRHGAKAAGPGNGGFEYGWGRGAGSAAFVVGTLIAGQVVSVTGLASAVLLHSGLLRHSRACISAARVSCPASNYAWKAIGPSPAIAGRSMRPRFSSCCTALSCFIARVIAGGPFNEA